MPNRPFQVDADAYPFQSHWFERQGSAMHYVDEGEGIPVVMCHGNPTWSYLYRNIIKALRGQCRCIAYDLPGFGMSEHPSGYAYTPQEHAQWVEALLIDHLKLDQFVLVMQDWGGPIGLRVATRNPDRVAGMVISSTWAWKTNLLGKVFSSILGSGLGRSLILNRNLFAKTLVPMFMNPESRKRIDLSAYTKPFPTPESRMGTAVFPKQIVAATPWLEEIESQLHRLADKPVHFVFGLKDLITKPPEIKRWLSHFPDATVIKEPSAAHYTQEDCPEHYVTAVRNILAKTAST